MLARRVERERAQWPEYEPRPAEVSIPALHATWTTGERTVERLAGWDKSSPAIELQSGPLEQPGRTVRTLRSTRIRSKLAATAGVHFVGDDFLPGVVVGLRTESIRAASSVEPLLAVHADVAIAQIEAAPSAND